MGAFIRSISFIFHPLLMPMFGVILFFYITPLSFPAPIVKAKLLAVFTLTILFPILLFQLLKTAKKANSIFLESLKERVVPLIINGGIIIYLIFRIFPPSEISVLYYFFLGTLISTVCCLILVWLRVKASIHMIASSGILMFCIALSLHYTINLLWLITIGFLLLGAIASSRLYMNAHSYKELIIGVFAGGVPQFILFNYWS